MLFKPLLTLVALISTAFSEGQTSKPFVFPIPFELPFRNERAEQCWLRVEDVELIETVTVYCTLAHEFLRSYIREYNSRKMLEDDVDVSLWSEEPRTQVNDLPKPPESSITNGHKIKDWKVTTVMDPTTRTRLYITQKADCSLIIYSREGMTNYRVNCAKVLYFMNVNMNSSAVLPRAKTNLIVAVCFVILYIWYF